jgi:hypothetical protein
MAPTKLFIPIKVSQRMAYTLYACMTKRVLEIPHSTHAFAVEKARIAILKKTNAIHNHKDQMTLNGTKRIMHLYYYLTSVIVYPYIYICGSSENLVIDISPEPKIKIISGRNKLLA